MPGAFLDLLGDARGAALPCKRLSSSACILSEVLGEAQLRQPLDWSSTEYGDFLEELGNLSQCLQCIFKAFSGNEVVARPLRKDPGAMR